MEFPRISQSYTVRAARACKPDTFTQEQVAAVLEPRVDEIADSIRNCIDDSGMSWATGPSLPDRRRTQPQPGRPGLSVGQAGKPVRDTVKRTIKLSSPIYASAMGLMDLIIDTIESRNVPPASGVAGGIKDFFRSLWAADARG